MIFLTSCSNKLLSGWVVLLLLAGCATLEPESPPLRVEALQTEQHGAAVGNLGGLEWSIQHSGAQGDVSVELWSQKQEVESLEYSGSLKSGSWAPNKPGHYRFKAVLTDQSGQKAESGWSKESQFAPALNRSSLFAALPIENLSDSRAPTSEIYAQLREALGQNSLQLLDQVSLDDFMKKYRMRHVGGLNKKLSRQFLAETGVQGVFLTTLETWQESSSPRVSLIMRLVMTGETPEIVWIDSVGLTGEDTLGLLGIGRIKDSRQLLNKAFDQLLDSFQNYLAGKMPEYRYAENVQMELLNAGRKTADESLGPLKNHLRPQFSYRASTFDPAGNYTVAVIPFLNINARKHAGKIVALHIVKQLHRYANIRVYEPGLVRETLLRYRMIMQSGPSLAASDVLSNEKILGADLVVSGKVFDFQGDVGESKVDFSIQAFDGKQREVVWASRSYATGNAGVYFYDFGKIPSAHGLVSRMTRAVIEQLEE